MVALVTEDMLTQSMALTGSIAEDATNIEFNLLLNVDESIC